MAVDKQKIERVISSINKFKTLSQIQEELSLDNSGLQDYEKEYQKRVKAAERKKAYNKEYAKAKRDKELKMLERFIKKYGKV